MNKDDTENILTYCFELYRLPNNNLVNVNGT